MFRANKSSRGSLQFSSDLDYEEPPPNQRLTSTFTASGFADDRDPLKLSFGDIRGLGSDFEVIS